jgi:hypothetical protein
MGLGANVMSLQVPAPWTPSESLSDEPHSSPSVRAQTAIVRTLADALEQLSPTSDAAGDLRQQLQEELARLGSRIEEAARNAR